MKASETTQSIREAALGIRRMIIDTAWRSRSAHVGSSLSCVDILAVLYFRYLRLDPADFEGRDYFVLSKGHAAMALYAALVARGLMDMDMLMGYHRNDGTLPAHLDRFANPWIEASAGSLGHGFNMALGMAYGCRIKGENRRVVTLIGDGESQEGSIWEGALFASKLGVDNFTAIIDHNNLQGYDRPLDICCYSPVTEKWRAFGWQVLCVDGHNPEQIEDALAADAEGRPKILIAQTVKGKGISFMEDQMKWHYYIVTDDLRRQALQELGGNP
jgi:transketolase